MKKEVLETQSCLGLTSLIEEWLSIRGDKTKKANFIVLHSSSILFNLACPIVPNPVRNHSSGAPTIYLNTSKPAPCGDLASSWEWLEPSVPSLPTQTHWVQQNMVNWLLRRSSWWQVCYNYSPVPASLAICDDPDSPWASIYFSLLMAPTQYVKNTTVQGLKWGNNTDLHHA